MGCQQVRRLGEEERKELEKQVAAFEARLAANGGDSKGAARCGARSALALGDAGKAAALLGRLTEAAPADSEAWQLLVRPPCFVA